MIKYMLIFNHIKISLIKNDKKLRTQTFVFYYIIIFYYIFLNLIYVKNLILENLLTMVILR